MEQIDSLKIRDLVLRERRLAVCEREWHHRLRGYGYGLRDSNEGRIVISLVRGGDLVLLPTAAT